MTNSTPEVPVTAQEIRLHLWAGLGVLIISLIHIPDDFTALNYFDPWKRLGWLLLSLVILIKRLGSPFCISRPLNLIWVSLFLFILVRAGLKTYPWAELEVLVSWSIPFLAFVVGALLGTGQGVRRWAMGVFVAAVIQASLMLLQYAGLDPLFSFVTGNMDYQPGRMIGTIGYHNQAADFLAVCAPSVFWVFRRNGLRLICLALLLGVILLVGSRGAIAGYVLALLVTAPLLLPQGNLAIRIAIIILAPVIFLSIFLPSNRDRLLEVFRHGLETPAVASRLVLNRVAIQMWTERTLTGWGAGEYALQYTDRLGFLLPEVKTHADLRNLVHAREAHHDILQFAAEFGLVGVLLVFLAAVFILRRLRRLDPDDPRRAAGWFVMVFMAVASTFSFSWQAAMAGPLAAWWLGMITNCAGEKSSCSRRGQHLVWVMAFVATLAFMGWQGIWARLSLSVPRALERGRIDRLDSMIPFWGHRFQALHGAALAANGKHDEADAVLSEAARGYIDVLFLNNHAHALGALGRWDEARVIYMRWARSGLNHRMAMDNLAAAHEALGDYAAAAGALASRMELWPDRDAEMLGRLAGFYHRAGLLDRVDWVMLDLRPRTGLPVDEVLPETLNLMGASLMQRGRYEEAKRWFLLALKHNPGLISARKNLETIERVAE